MKLFIHLTPHLEASVITSNHFRRIEFDEGKRYHELARDRQLDPQELLRLSQEWEDLGYHLRLCSRATKDSALNWLVPFGTCLFGYVGIVISLGALVTMGLGYLLLGVSLWPVANPLAVALLGVCALLVKVMQPEMLEAWTVQRESVRILRDGRAADFAALWQDIREWNREVPGWQKLVEAQQHGVLEPSGQNEAMFNDALHLQDQLLRRINLAGEELAIGGELGACTENLTLSRLLELRIAASEWPTQPPAEERCQLPARNS